jgi:hypothetical protein
MNSTVDCAGVQTDPHLPTTSQEKWTRHINTRRFEHSSIPHSGLRQNWFVCCDVFGFISSARDTPQQNGPDAFSAFQNPELLAQETQ